MNTKAKADADDSPEASSTESFNVLAGLLNRFDRLAKSADSLPAQIEQARADAAAAHTAAVEVDVNTIGEIDLSDPERGEFEARADELTRKAVMAEATQRRLEARLPAIEKALDELNTEISMERQIVTGDVKAFLLELAERQMPELTAVLAAVKPVVARVMVILRHAPDALARQYEAFVGDPGHERAYLGSGEYSRGPNLLEPDAQMLSAAQEALAGDLEPALDALEMARDWKPYVPHASRPKPYVRQGTLVEYSGGSPVYPGEAVTR